MILYRTLLVLPVLAGLAGPAHAEVDFSTAVTQTKVLQGDIEAFNAVAVQAVGPYKQSYEHTVVTQTVIDGRIYTNHFTYHCATTIDFGSIQKQLVNTVQAVPTGIAALQNATDALTKWNGVVPATSARFNALVEQQKQLQISSQTGFISDDQKRAFDDSLNLTQDSIGSSTFYLQQSSQAMALFIQQSTDYQKTVSQAINLAGNSTTQTLDNANNDIKKQGCPSGLGGDYQRIQGDFNAWIGRLNDAEAKSANDSTSAQKGAADLAAFSLASQQNLASIQKELAAAAAQDYATFIQQLDISVAQSQWNAIAAQAAR